jgi:hypothetical protein
VESGSDVEHRLQTQIDSMSRGSVEEGPSDSLPAGCRRDEKAGNDPKAIQWMSRYLAGEIHDRVGTVGMESDMADEVAADLCYPGSDRTRRGNESPEVAREVGRIAIQVVNNPGESFTPIEIRIRAGSYDHLNTIAHVPTSPGASKLASPWVSAHFAQVRRPITEFLKL